MKKHVPESTAEENETGFIDLGLEMITNAITGVSIPKPIRQNAFKAFGRLWSAAIEVPAVYFEGIVEEKRAESAARVTLIETSATQIARQMEVDPEYARVAVKKFGRRIIREQVNLDLVGEAAARELKQLAPASIPPAETVGEIDDDWLNQFEKEASQRSTEDMQRMFGRILAGEIRKPSSYSIKAIKILGELDKVAAALFKRFCAACIVKEIPQAGHILDARVLSLGGNAGGNALQKYGFSFNQLNILHEYGLIIADYHSWMDYKLCVANKENSIVLGFVHQNSEWGLVPQAEREENTPLKLHGVALSHAGRELLRIIDIDPIEDYTTDLNSFFENLNLKMTPAHRKTTE